DRFAVVSLRMSASAAASERLSTATRTTSASTDSNWCTCATVAATSAVLVAVIDWTAALWPAPTLTVPTFTARGGFRTRRSLLGEDLGGGVAESLSVVGAVAERLLLGVAAAAEREGVLRWLDDVAFGVEQRDLAAYEQRTVLLDGDRRALRGVGAHWRSV